MTRRGFRQIASLPASPGGAELVEVEVAGASYQVPASVLSGFSYRRQTALQLTLSQPVGANAFTDDTGKVVTVSGGVVGVADAGVPGGLCASFPAGGRISIATSLDFQMAAVMFGVEGWFKTTQVGQQYSTLFERDNGSFTDGSYALLFNVDSANDGKLAFYHSDFTAPAAKTTIGGYNDGVRHHVYAGRMGQAWEIWVDGVRASLSTIVSVSMSVAGNNAPILLGNSVYASRGYVGRMDNWRMVRGVLPYTVSPFTVPVPPFPTV